MDLQILYVHERKWGKGAVTVVIHGFKMHLLKFLKHIQISSSLSFFFSQEEHLLRILVVLINNVVLPVFTGISLLVKGDPIHFL